MNGPNRNLNEKSIEAQVRSGLKTARIIRTIFVLVLVCSSVILFSFLDTPMQPYLVMTAIVMGVIIIAWGLLKGGTN
jgi:protein-S-isoprenylcysteine O-methyltransferase Ste14